MEPGVAAAAYGVETAAEGAVELRWPLPNRQCP